MSPDLLDLSQHPALLLAGWSVLVVLWHSTVIALLLGGWRLLRPQAPALHQYRAASVALVATFVLACGTPAVLLWQGSTTPSVAAQGPPGPSASFDERISATASGPLMAAPAMGPHGNRVAGWIGLVWVVGVGIALARLAGGWGMALWIRHQSSPVSSPEVLVLPLM